MPEPVGRAASAGISAPAALGLTCAASADAGCGDADALFAAANETAASAAACTLEGARGSELPRRGLGRSPVQAHKPRAFPLRIDIGQHLGGLWWRRVAADLDGSGEAQINRGPDAGQVRLGKIVALRQQPAGKTADGFLP